MTLNLAITISISFLILFLGAVVYFNNRKSATNLLFFVISVSTVFWSISNYFSVIIETEVVLFWIRMVLFFAAPHAVFFALFMYNFPNDKWRIRKRTFLAILFFTVFLMSLSVSPYVFNGYSEVSGNIVPTTGPLIILYAFSIVTSIFIAFVIGIKKYIKTVAEERVRWRYMLLGTFISYFSLIVTNLILVNFFGNTTFVIYAPVFMAPTFIGGTYAILKHHLLNVKVITTEITVFALLFVSLVQIFISSSVFDFVLRITVFVLLAVFSAFLVKSVRKEVEQREKIEKLAVGLEKANERLKELDQLKSEFLSFAAHQIRSPLTAIKGYASMLTEGDFGKMSKKTLGAVEVIKTSAESLIVIVNEFLNISRIEQGRMKYDMVDFNLEDLVKEVTTELTPNLEDKGLKFSLDIKEGSYKISADEGKIKQIIQNIIDNAIKYTPKGFVKVSVDKKDNFALVAVTDSGIGIDKDEISKLFSKFSRTKDAHKTNVSGTGLGLYVARQMLTAHKGEITVTSPGKNKGSTFTIKIPLKNN